jgi:hypothetical protein
METMRIGLPLSSSAAMAMPGGAQRPERRAVARVAYGRVRAENCARPSDPDPCASRNCAGGPRKRASRLRSDLSKLIIQKVSAAHPGFVIPRTGVAVNALDRTLRPFRPPALFLGPGGADQQWSGLGADAPFTRVLRLSLVGDLSVAGWRRGVVGGRCHRYSSSRRKPSSNGRSADDLARGRRCGCDRCGGVVGGGVRGPGRDRPRGLNETPLPSIAPEHSAKLPPGSGWLCAVCSTPPRPSPCRARRRDKASVRTSRRGRRRGGAPCSCRREARPSSGSGGAG